MTTKLTEALEIVERCFDDAFATKLAVLETEVRAVAALIPPDERRWMLLAALATMPDEAFSWFVLACLPKAMTNGGLTQIWPDGMGGFMPASRASVEAVRKAADAYLNQPDVPKGPV